MSCLGVERMGGLGATQENIRVDKDNASVVLAFVHGFAANAVLRQVRSRPVACRPCLEGCHTFVRRRGLCVANNAAPSIIERRYSSRVMPFAWACANNPVSTSGLRFSVTVIMLILI